MFISYLWNWNLWLVCLFVLLSLKWKFVLEGVSSVSDFSVLHKIVSRTKGLAFYGFR